MIKLINIYIYSFFSLIFFSYSQFQVEYKDSLGQTRLTLTEAPNEALPLDCRPNFGAAWLTKDKFKVDVAKLVVFCMLWHIL